MLSLRDGIIQVDFHVASLFEPKSGPQKGRRPTRKRKAQEAIMSETLEKTVNLANAIQKLHTAGDY